MMCMSRALTTEAMLSVEISLNSMRPTPTPTRMRLSCNFVNVYTIAYRVQYVRTRASLTDNLARILARKSARVGRVGGQVGEDCRACPARGKLNGDDFHARILARKFARMSVGVGVGPMEFKLYEAAKRFCYMREGSLTPNPERHGTARRRIWCERTLWLKNRCRWHLVMVCHLLYVCVRVTVNLLQVTDNCRRTSGIFRSSGRTCRLLFIVRTPICTHLYHCTFHLKSTK